jgi:hypothetical protein
MLAVLGLPIFDVSRDRGLLSGYRLGLLQTIIFHRRNLCSDTLGFGLAELPCP